VGDICFRRFLIFKDTFYFHFFGWGTDKKILLKNNCPFRGWRVTILLNIFVASQQDTSWADYSEDDFILSIHELSAHSSGCQILGFIYFGLYL